MRCYTQTRKKKKYHANLLKLWRELEGHLATLIPKKEELRRALEEVMEGAKEWGKVPIG